MDPGSPKLQEVFNAYASDFKAANPGADTLPVVIVFIVLRKHLTRGTTAGAVKG